jgi:hypothetical protein
MKYKELAKKLAQMHVEEDPYGDAPVYAEVDFKTGKINQVVNCFKTPVFEKSKEATDGCTYSSGKMLLDHWNKQKELEKNYEIWLRIEMKNRGKNGVPFIMTPDELLKGEEDNEI